MPNVDTDICRTCGTMIQEERFQCGLFLQWKRDRCNRCAYEEYRRGETCCRRPFKKPYPRAKQDGSLPEEFLNYIQQRKVEG